MVFPINGLAGTDNKVTTHNLNSGQSKLQFYKLNLAKIKTWFSVWYWKSKSRENTQKLCQSQMTEPNKTKQMLV